MAGEEIDATFGVKFGLSTLASAGLGNLVSDVAGIGFAEQIEVCVHPQSMHITKISILVGNMQLFWMLEPLQGTT